MSKPPAPYAYDYYDAPDVETEPMTRGDVIGTALLLMAYGAIMFGAGCFLAGWIEGACK